MTKRKLSIRDKPLTSFAGRLVRYLIAFQLALFFVSVANANSLSQYHERVKQAVTALGTLSTSDKNETQTQFETRDHDTVQRVKELLPQSESLDHSGTTVSIDNSWLHLELTRYAQEPTQGRYEMLKRITERVQAIDDRITAFDKAEVVRGGSKEEESRKLEEILSRSEYAYKKKEESPISRWLDKLIKWLRDFLPQPKPMSPGGAGIVSKIAQVVVVVLALGVIAFVIKTFLPKLLREGRTKRKRKEKARIVLGERLEPEQSARDLLTEAEALARRGELRAAIRRGYIALLVELGDRKIISLAQYKTNHDYLRAMRGLEPLYRNVKQLTDSFELHWYGLSQADETDWVAFRAAYDQALR